MLLRHLYLTHRLKQQIKSCSNKALKTHLGYLLNNLNTPLSQLNLLAIDIEMTGLNAKKDQMVSIGAIVIKQLHIKSNSAQHKLLKIQGSVGQSATIHGVLDEQLKYAIELQDALHWLLELIKDKVLIAHHAPLDMQFLQQAFTNLKIDKPTFFAIDTLAIEKKRLFRQQPVLKDGSLRLNACRENYQLPAYFAHNALTDALACAELFLAQSSQLEEQDKLTLARLLSIK